MKPAKSDGNYFSNIAGDTICFYYLLYNKYSWQRVVKRITDKLPRAAEISNGSETCKWPLQYFCFLFAASEGG